MTDTNPNNDTERMYEYQVEATWEEDEHGTFTDGTILGATTPGDALDKALDEQNWPETADFSFTNHGELEP